MSEAREIAAALACGQPGCACSRQNGGPHYRTHCPAHSDAHPSLDLKDGDRRTLVRCLAGCATPDVIEALRTRHLWGSNGSTPSPARETRYEIRRPEDGALVAVHVRRDLPNGEKSFHWARPDGTPGLGGISAARLPLYRAERLAALPDGALVVVTEGEKAADALRARGVEAVASVTGAAGTPGEDALRPLARLSPVLWPDCDDPGRGHMQRIAARLEALGCENVRVVDWPEAPDKGDAFDFSGDAEALAALIDDAVKPPPAIIAATESWGIEVGGNNKLSSLRPLRAEEFIAQAAREPDVPDLMAGFIPAGTLTLLVAHPKAGKSRLARTICRLMETGGELCGHPIAKGPSLYLALEERPEDVRAHLAALGSADTLVVARPLRMGTETLELVRAWITEFGLKLIVIDSLNRFWLVESGSDRRQADQALTPLLGLAHTTGCTVLVLHHLRKSGGEEGTDIAESNDIHAIADQVLYLRRDKEHERRRLLQAPGLGRYAPQADLILEIGEDGLYTGLGEAEAIRAAEENAALLDALGDWLTAEEVADATGISERTCRRRLKDLVKSGRAERAGKGSRGDPARFRRLVTNPLADGWQESAETPDFEYENNCRQPRSQGLKGLAGIRRTNRLRPEDGHLVRYAVEHLGAVIVGRTPAGKDAENGT